MAKKKRSLSLKTVLKRRAKRLKAEALVLDSLVTDVGSMDKKQAAFLLKNMDLWPDSQGSLDD